MSVVTPSGFTSGQITIPAATPTNLGQLVLANLDPNASQVAFLVSIQADSGNGGPVFFGMDSTVSAAKYGYSLAAGLDRQFSISASSSGIQWARWYVFSTASGVLHIEIMP